MAQRSFRRGEPMSKSIKCACGSNTKLIKRRNFPHGVKSGARTIILYKCPSCMLQTFPSAKPQVRRR